MTTTRTRYNKSKIMRNAWYLKRANASMTFSACLRKAWRNEKLAVMTAIIENRLMVNRRLRNGIRWQMFRPTTTATAERITETNDNRGRTAPQHLLRKLKNSEILAKPR